MALPLSDRPFEIEIFLDRHKRNAAINLASSGVNQLALADVLRLASDDQRRRFFDARLDYAPHRGAPQLIEAIARHYAHPLKAADIAVTSGAQEAIYIVLTALLAQGGDAVVVVPGYHGITAVAEQYGRVRHVALEAGDGFRLPLHALLDAVTDETVLVALSFPNNPTAATISRDILEEVVGFCRGRGIWLVCDEMYRGTELDPAWTLPSVAEIYERGVAIDGVSKRYGIPGERIGWLACRDPRLLGKCRTLRSYLSVCNSCLAEIVAEIVLSAPLSMHPIVRRAKANLQRLQAFAGADVQRLRLQESNATLFAFPRVPRRSSDTLCRKLLAATGTLILPGRVFNQGISRYDDYFRVNLAGGSSAEGIGRLLSFLEE